MTLRSSAVGVSYLLEMSKLQGFRAGCTALNTYLNSEFCSHYVNRFLRHLQTIVLRTRDSISNTFLGGRLSKRDPAEALATEWHFAKTGKRGRRLFVFLPGRRDRGLDFFRRGFIALAQARVPGLDCVAVDATIG
jgi:1-acyl-sn-glycerol-3-phosphate acyltransferase